MPGQITKEQWKELLDEYGIKVIDVDISRFHTIEEARKFLNLIKIAFEDEIEEDRLIN